MRTNDTRLLLSGNYSEDNSTASRIAGLIRRNAPRYMVREDRGKPVKKPELKEVLIAKLASAESLTSKEIAARVLVSEKYVQRFARQNGIELRPKTRAIKVKPGMRKKEQCT